VLLNGQLVESFSNLSMTGVSGTRPVIGAVNDPLSGSRYINIVPPAAGAPAPGAQVWTLAGGTNPGTPTAAELVGSPITNAMRTIESPLVVSFQPYRKADGTIVMPQASAGVTTALNANGRTDCFVVWDGNPLALVSSGTYVANVQALAATIGTADSYSALYAPWIITPDPSRAGSTVIVPPSGSVQGMIARVDATQGPWRAPAGIPAVLSTAVAPEVKFTDTDQGTLNYGNVNVIRAVPGSGICVMGARTRKLFGPDRYVSARRTLIYIEEALKLSTQWAIFENNDQRLWSSLRNTAQNILQPIWEAGGLAGNTAAEAYYITCDRTINTAQVIQNGEVRMEIGVALQYPAEFVIIRISQIDSGVSLANEVLAA
jgi:phage tail sheath protein FI